jgi:NitT/TauT family transport system permease protein
VFVDRLRLLLPDSHKLTDQALNHWAYYLSHWLDTLSVSLIACALATFCAGCIAVFGLRFPAIHRIVSPLSAMSQSFPLQALGPVIIIALGAGFLTKSLIAFVITFFPIQSVILTAFADTPGQYLLFAKVCNAGFFRTFWSMRLPFALPRIVTALKLGFTMSVIGAVVAEFISPQGGIGEVLLISQSSFNIEAIYICLSMLICQGLAIYLGLSELERRLTSHRRVGA